LWPPRDITVYDDVELELELTGAGWANLVLRVGSEKVRIDGFSDIENSFHDLALAGVSAAASGGQGFFRFAMNGEPMEWRWTINSLFRQGWSYYSHVQVEEFPDDNHLMISEDGRYVPRSDAPEGKLVFDVFCSSEAFAEAIRTAFVPLEELGADEFEKKWGLTPFPTRTLAALSAALDTPRRWNDPKTHDASEVVSSTKRH
jgi:hypothetical protein